MAYVKELCAWLCTVGTISLTVLAGSAAAQVTDDDNLLVKATVLGDCSVEGSVLDFGTYNGDAKETSTNIKYKCEATNIEIALSQGNNFDQVRHMKNADGDFLPYFLFKESTSGDEWGDATGTVGPFTKRKVLSAVNGTSKVVGFIPEAPGGVTPPAGTYSDIVKITLTAN